jgi:hypothetical protein
MTERALPSARVDSTKLLQLACCQKLRRLKVCTSANLHRIIVFCRDCIRIPYRINLHPAFRPVCRFILRAGMCDGGYLGQR